MKTKTNKLQLALERDHLKIRKIELKHSASDRKFRQKLETLQQLKDLLFINIDNPIFSDTEKNNIKEKILDIVSSVDYNKTTFRRKILTEKS